MTMIHLGGAYKHKWNSQRRYAVIQLVNDKPEVMKRTDSGSTARAAYSSACAAGVAWLLDSKEEDMVVATSFQAMDLETTERVIQEARAKEKAKTKRATRRQPGAACECGCGGTTGGGRYLPGHDAKHKSILIEAGLKGDESALATLNEKGWMKFLEKKREILVRPKSEVIRVRKERDQETAEQAIQGLLMMKAAGEVLKDHCRYHKRDVGYVPITKEDSGAIADGSFDYVLYDELVADGWELEAAARKAAE